MNRPKDTRRRLPLLALVFAVSLVLVTGVAAAGGNARLTNDCHPGACGAGYVSAYTLATGLPYSDATLDECTVAHGRQNEPAVAVDPRNTSVLLGSSNDYCGVYNTNDANGNPIAAGPIWLGYYRSQDSGSSWVSSLVPGYPGRHLPVRPARADPHGERRRPGDRLGQPRPRLLRLGEVGRPGGDREGLRRPVGRAGS